MVSNIHDLGALVKDCFVVLHRARRVDYVGGDGWRLEEGEIEHPLVPRLRAACMVSITTEPPKDDEPDDTTHLLRSERRANDKMRVFLRRLEDLCLEKGMSQGDDVLKWLEAAIG